MCVKLSSVPFPPFADPLFVLISLSAGEQVDPDTGGWIISLSSSKALPTTIVLKNDGAFQPILHNNP